MEHFTLNFLPDNKQVVIHKDATVLEAAGQAGIVLNTTCGGRGTCGKCEVFLQPSGQKVLACQYKVQSDLTVTIPDTSRFFKQKILSCGLRIDIKLDPAVYKHALKIESFNPSQVENFLNSRQSKKFTLTSSAIRKLKELSSDQDCRFVTAICHISAKDNGYNVVDFEKGMTIDTIFGIAVDIGTTTVVAKLVDMTNSKSMASEATLNPQIKYGDDVISRINYADTDEKLSHLQHLIINCLNELTAKLCRQTGIDKNNIYEMTIACNTTMNHIFLGWPVKQLGQAPYKPYSVQAANTPAEDLGVDINPLGNIYTIENIAGFVGSDTTAVAVAVDIDNVKETTLVIDIGTNGEIILAMKDKFYCASCAAGPALEGARISQGSRASEGAIEAVIMNKTDIDIDVIGDSPAISICGSGLIDAVAVMLDLGVIDRTGRFVSPQELEGKVPEAIIKRFSTINSQPAFKLSKIGPEVFLTQKDIRETQLAKAAIRTGIKLLQKKLQLADSDIDCLLLAGAFGNYIRKESALKIGLLPDMACEKIHFIGNAASSGAEMILLNRHFRNKATTLAKKIEYVEIAHETDFSMVYADCMFF
ncbi:MAG TPA: ASKHA domain-containing protein [Sedimentisphaerales bacterium]|nr:ASKHA domain-containing protein [Sedimentisphaerales bacterium]